MSVKKTVKGVAARLEKESGGGKGINNEHEGELHHIEIHPAENGWRVEHHTHKKRERGMDFPPYGTDKEEHVFENHAKACKHCKGIMEEHSSLQDADEMHETGELEEGEKPRNTQKEGGSKGRSGY